MQFLKTTLWLAVVFNITAAALLMYPHSSIGQFFALPPDVPALYQSLAAYFVLLFGCAYAWMALQKDAVRPLLYFGVFGKSGAFLVVIALWFLGQASTSQAVLVVGDAVFAAVWATWLHRTKPSSAA